ncbi:hypothetical protein [Aquimarina sp. MMG016]|uniref:hypothetical protein n=1 Tax=Aquimarina sp. MMG016 TaxID=2822690 RepID=UPI001B3A33E9|nr:hypothetical protein [Aquimarina sp. MMG016]MBQ4820609.1 hypothetical protein [Aquimarina sp. MMG016]
MSLKNLINVSFTEEEVTALTGHLTGIEQILEGKTVNLTAEERTKYGRIANQNKLLVDKAKNYMKQHPDWIPSFLDKDRFDRDYVTRGQVEEMIQLLENYTQQLVDTKTLLDHDNYSNALSFHRKIRFLAEEDEPGSKTVYNDMKLLFRSRRGNTTISADEGDTTSEEEVA